MIHIFDIDRTVIKKTSVGYFLREALSAKKSPIRFSHIRRLPFDLIKYKLGSPDMDFIENAVKALEGVEKSALERLAEDCFQRRIRRGIYAEAARLIREALQKGERVIFATSSLKTVIQPLERFFGIEGSLASELEFRDGKTTGRLCGNSLFGGKKKEAVENWLKTNRLSAADVSFYSDSYTDIPLLEICGNPIAVNPDRALAREAKKRGWKILWFRGVLEQKK